MARYTVKLLFDWYPDPVTGNRVMRLSEERIVVFHARSPRAAVERAKRLGKQAELFHFEENQPTRSNISKRGRRTV